MTGRLHGRTVFHTLREQGVRVRSGWLWCSVVIDPALGQPHVGYALGRQVGNAVERNRIRRRLRVLMTRHGAELPSGHYLVGVSPRASQPTWRELEVGVERLVAAIRGKLGAS